MKKMLTTLVLALAALCAAAEEKGETPEAKEARIAAARAKFQQKIKDAGGWDKFLYQMNGGRIVKEGSGEGKVCLVNAQSKLDGKALEEFAQKTEMLHQIRLEVVGGEPVTVANAGEALKKTGAQAAVFLVDDPKLPPTLVAYDSLWAIVNVAAFGEGPKALVEQRRVKAVYRAFALLCGAADTSAAGSLFWAAPKPEDYDAVNLPSRPVPAVMQNIEAHMSRVGVKPQVVMTYFNACKAGWAPAPTNDVQRKVWEKVHALPKTPMKIEYDPKKGK